MGRHPTRKKISAHNRGEHKGYNLLWAQRGCPSCQEDVEKVMEERDAAFDNAKSLLIERVINESATGG